MASLIIGFVLAAPSLNHAVVGFGEVIFGIFAGTAESDWGDLVRNVASPSRATSSAASGSSSRRASRSPRRARQRLRPGGAGSQPDADGARDGNGTRADAPASLEPPLRQPAQAATGISHGAAPARAAAVASARRPASIAARSAAISAAGRRGCGW
jgi:hypothetical protein